MKTKKTIVIPIDSALILRNFGLLQRSVIAILEEVYHIVLLVPEDAQQATMSLFGDKDIEIVPITDNKKKNRSQQVFDFFAEHLIFSEGAQLHAFYGVRINETRLSPIDRFKYIIKLLISSTIGKSYYVRNTIFPKLRFLFFKNREVGALLEKYKPDLVFLPNIHCALDLSVLMESKKRNIKTVGMPGSWDHLPKKYVPLHADFLLVQNEIIRDEAIAFHDYESEKIKVVGFPYYDMFASKEMLLPREEFLQQFGFDARKKMLLFVSAAIFAPDEGDCVDMVLNAMNQKKLPPDLQIFIRTYPGVGGIEHEKFDAFDGNKNVFIQWIRPKKDFGDPWLPTKEDIVFFLNLIHHADIIVNTITSVALESSALLRPLINLRFDGYKNRPYALSVRRFARSGHYRHVYEANGGVLVESEEELITAIQQFLENPHFNDHNIMRMRDRLCWKVDGKASERIAHEISAVLEH